MKTTEADTRKPYNGRTRSLVIAVDVGTTFSGVSYAVLEPGEIPKIHGVTRCALLPLGITQTSTLTFAIVVIDSLDRNM